MKVKKVEDLIIDKNILFEYFKKISNKKYESIDSLYSFGVPIVVLLKMKNPSFIKRNNLGTLSILTFEAIYKKGKISIVYVENLKVRDYFYLKFENNKLNNFIQLEVDIDYDRNGIDQILNFFNHENEELLASFYIGIETVKNLKSSKQIFNISKIESNSDIDVYYSEKFEFFKNKDAITLKENKKKKIFSIINITSTAIIFLGGIYGFLRFKKII